MNTLLGSVSLVMHKCFALLIAYCFVGALACGSHVKQRTVEYKGQITAISEKLVKIKGPSGLRVFKFAVNSVVGPKREFVRGTCLMGDSGTKLKFTEVFKVGDEVSVLYFEENAGKETTAADVWFADDEKATAWRKANLGHP